MKTKAKVEVKTFGVVARFKAPAGYYGVWVNVYRSKHWKVMRTQTGGAYARRREADDISKGHRHDCVYVHVRA